MIKCWFGRHSWWFEGETTLDDDPMIITHFYHCQTCEKQLRIDAKNMGAENKWGLK